MPDMLVKLYDIAYNFNVELLARGITIKKACIIDKSKVLDFVRENFKNEAGWVHECEYALLSDPPSCYVAVRQKEIIGFACCNATAKGFFGPMGVKEGCRKSGIGRELLLRALYSMQENGYAYAIIGWPAHGAIDFYKKNVNAIEIEDSPPNKSIYKNLISSE